MRLFFQNKIIKSYHLELLTDRLIIKKWYEVHVELGRIKPSIEECTKGTYLTQNKC